jgi:hypothetical protein
MQNHLAALNERLNHSVGELSPPQYIEAKRYFSQVGDAIAALSGPNADPEARRAERRSVLWGSR